MALEKNRNNDREKNDNGLTEKQQVFVEKFCLICAKEGRENWAKAARIAGYKSDRTMAFNLKNNLFVRQAIKDRMANILEKVELSPEFVLKNLMEVYNRAMQITPVKDKSGKVIGEFRFDGKVANRSLELIAKVLGISSDTIIHRSSPEFESAMRALFVRVREKVDKAKEVGNEVDVLLEASKKTEAKSIIISSSATLAEEKEEPFTFEDEITFDESDDEEDN